MGKLRAKNKAVFIDRDGTIIHERHYLSRIRDVKLFAGAVRGLASLRSAGFKLIMVTNQSGIGRGYLTEKKLLKIHKYIQDKLHKQSVAFDAIFYCKHIPDDNCRCRKPRTGMVDAAAKMFNLDLKNSYVIGDHVNDFLLAKNMGGKGVFVLTGHGKEELQKITEEKVKARPDKISKNFTDAVKWVISDNDR